MQSQTAAVVAFPVAVRNNVVSITSPRVWNLRPRIVAISHQQAVDLVDELGEGIAQVDLHNAMVVTGRHRRYGNITIVMAANGECCVTSRHTEIDILSK